jgi:hypothetical protein
MKLTKIEKKKGDIPELHQNATSLSHLSLTTAPLVRAPPAPHFIFALYGA